MPKVEVSYKLTVSEHDTITAALVEAERSYREQAQAAVGGDARRLNERAAVVADVAAKIRG